MADCKLCYTALIGTLEKCLPPPCKLDYVLTWVVNIKTDYHNKRYRNKYVLSLLGDILVRLYKVLFQYIVKILNLRYNTRS